MKTKILSFILFTAGLVFSASSVTFVAEFAIGDKNLATFSEDGLYAVSYKEISNALAAYNRQSEIQGIEVDKLCLFASAQDTLTDKVPSKALIQPNQIFEIPIKVIDHSKNSMEANQIFDDQDTLVFVGYGTSFWKRADSENPSYENGSMDYFFSASPFSFYQSFQLGWHSSKKGLRMSHSLNPPASMGNKLEWMRYVRAEKDVLLRDSYYGKEGDWENSTGREWFWLWHSRFDESEYSSTHLSMPHAMNFLGRINGGREYLGMTFFPYRSVSMNTADKKNDQVYSETMSNKSYEERLKEINFRINVNGKSQDKSAAKLMPGNTFVFNNPGYRNKDNSIALTMLPNNIQYDRFDGYTIAYQWNPVIDSTEWLLPGKFSGVIQIPVGSSPKLRVMKFLNQKEVGLLLVENGIAKDSAGPTDDVRYLIYNEGKYNTHIKVKALPSKPKGVLKNIAEIDKRTQYLIITASEFLDAAVTLGKFRASGIAVTQFATSIVAVEDIYRMYTGGSLSPNAIRNYIAYAKSRCPNLKYVLLAGSGHYDYRGLNTKLGKIFIPPYEKESASTDDFYAALDSGELVITGNYDLDVSVGRLPVSSLSDFSNYIEKIKDYEQIGLYNHGEWRSTLLFAADDAANGSITDYTEHTKLQEELAQSIDSLSKAQKNHWNLKKIYLLDYPVDASGQKKDAVEDFINIMNQGALITTYFGHGSITDWASEGLLKPSYISKLSNQGRTTILNSFSCTVGRFDKGDAHSLSEEFVLASKVGSIASVGSTRETYSIYNESFGKGFVKNLLKTPGALIGDALIDIKNAASKEFSKQRYNNELYVLIGEPVVQMPKTTMKVNFDQEIDTLKALDKITLSGNVSGMDKGSIAISLREGKYSKRLFNGLDVKDDSLDVVYDGALLYSEEVPVVAGKFKTEFISPKKLSFGDSSAEMSAWAFSANEKNIGRYLKDKIRISGISSYANQINDNEPPSIKIQSCYTGGIATSFSNEQTVKLQSPACLQIEINDSTALDFREQADEGVTFEVIGIENPHHPAPYIEQTSKRVLIRKTFSSESYPEGKYVFKVRAQDVLGNTAEQVLNLEITGEMQSGLTDVFNIPNPVKKKGTTFYFKNLAIDRKSVVNIFIYNQNGRLVKVIKNAISGVTHWDGRDNHGRLLANGLYHYVVRSEVEESEKSKNSTWTKKQKLLISR